MAEDERSILDALREQVTLRKELVEATEIQKETEKQLAKQMRELENERALALQAAARGEENAKERLKQLEESMESLRETQEEARKETEAGAEALKRYEERIRALGSVASEIIGPFNQLGTSLSGFIKVLIKGAHTLDGVGVELAKTTGYASAMRDNMVALADSTNGLNLSFAESGKIVGALSLGYKDFNMLNEQAQRSLAETVGRLYRLGVDAGQAAQAMDMLENALGLTRIAAERTVSEFEDLAMATGQPVSQLVQDFNNLAPAIARFGDRGTAVFNELAKDARRLGLTVQQAFDVTELFDTFQGAADVAGKLNSQLGLQLNSVEIMGASSEDRLKILRAEFNLQGRSFDSLGKRQKQMIAEILQTDVNMAARLFGDPMELRRAMRDQEEQQQRLEKFTTATQKLQEAFEQMFVKVEPILTSFTTALGKIAEFFGAGISAGTVFAGVMMRLGVAVAGGLKGLAEILKVTKGLSKVFAGMGGALSVITGFFDYIATGDPLYGLMSAAGSFTGMMAGAAIGSAIFPGVGTILGGMIGSFLGSTAFKAIYGKPKTEDENIEEYEGHGIG